jgi:hypothetical protein
VLWPGGAGAQVDVNARISGYLEHQFSASTTDRRWRQIDYDRFRLDVDARAGLGTRVSAAVVWQIYRGNTRIELRDVLPSALDPLVDTAFIELEDQQFLNHAYVTLRPGPFELTAGKQYLTWGAAWVFNPTELFRPKNILEPTYEREGVGAVALALPVGPLSDGLVAYVPEGSFETSGKVFRVRHHVAGFDLSALVGELHEAPGSALGSDLLAGTASPLERRYTIGGDLSGELLGLGIWAEATWSDHADRQWVEATVGGNYTLSDRTLLLLEGFYNGRGEWDDPYPIDLWFGRTFGATRSLGKVVVFGMVSRPLGQLWTLGMSALGNPGDGSAVLIPSVAYAFAENVDLLFNGVVYLGAEGAEFGADTYGGFLRGRVYF